MAWRLRARLRFTNASGLGPWAYAQNEVRLGMAVTLNGGTPYQEVSFHSVVTTGPTAGRGLYTADLAFPEDRHDLAVDTYNTLTAPSVIAPVYLNPPSTGYPPTYSFVEVHHCLHDVGGPCDPPELRWADQ